MATGLAARLVPVDLQEPVGPPGHATRDWHCCHRCHTHPGTHSTWCQGLKWELYREMCQHMTDDEASDLAMLVGTELVTSAEAMLRRRSDRRDAAETPAAEGAAGTGPPGGRVSSSAASSSSQAAVPAAVETTVHTGTPRGSAGMEQFAPSTAKPGACPHGCDPGTCLDCARAFDWPMIKANIWAGGVLTVTGRRIPRSELPADWRTRWWYLDCANRAVPCLRDPFGVPFELRNPAAVGVNISDSSLRRLVTDTRPCQYRRVWEDIYSPGATGEMQHRTVWTTAVSGCAMVGEATTHKFSTLAPFIRAWIGYQGKMQFFVMQIKDCVYDPTWV